MREDALPPTGVTRDFTFVEDAVSATIAAAARGVPGRVYNIGGGSRVSVNEVLEMVTRIHRWRAPI
jgi:UDP-glucose 4-epimerase